jgi:hypothetical protein
MPRPRRRYRADGSRIRPTSRPRLSGGCRPLCHEAECSSPALPPAITRDGLPTQKYRDVIDERQSERGEPEAVRTERRARNARHRSGPRGVREGRATLGTAPTVCARMRSGSPREDLHGARPRERRFLGDRNARMLHRVDRSSGRRRRATVRRFDLGDARTATREALADAQRNSRGSHHGKNAGRSADTRSGNVASRFSRKAPTPSRLSADVPRDCIERLSTSCAAIG